MSTLLSVNRQWSTRPADETFPNLQSAYEASLTHFHNSREKADVIPSTLRVQDSNGEVELVGKGGVSASLTHWSFGQLSGLVGAPASFLRDLPATLASQVLNNRMKARYGSADDPVDPDARVNLLFRKNGELTVRSVNSDKYSRIWNHELIRGCLDLETYGWSNPRPFNTGDSVGTVWVSDHDMFVFQVNDSNLVRVPGSDRQLRRGYIMSNSEVGAARWKTMMFLFDYMCCNRMIWGATEVSEISVRHVGRASERVGEILERFEVQAQKYLESSGREEELKIARAISRVIADTKEGVIEKVFKLLRDGGVTRKVIAAGYDVAEQRLDTSAGPGTVWGLAQGLTRYSQSVPYTDERMVIDRGAGKLIEMVDQF